MDQPTPQEPNNEQDLWKIMTWATVLGFGATGAVMFSFKDMATSPRFVFSWGTIVAFAIGGFLGWLLWYIVRKKVAAEPADKKSRPR